MKEDHPPKVKILKMLNIATPMLSNVSIPYSITYYAHISSTSRGILYSLKAWQYVP